MIDRDTFLQRARQRAEFSSYWTWVVGLVEGKGGISISSRGEYSQKQWNVLQAAKQELIEPWE